ncbi:MAG: hypothetical protein QM472_05475 [Spirochaetota bacterium]|nr:hypothetical protein [Spirochaetota bacterium]
MNKVLSGIITLVVLLNCSSSRNVIVNPKFSLQKYNKIALIPETVKFQKSNAEIAAFVSAMEAEFMRMGFDVLDRENINRLMAEQELSQTATDTPTIGKLLGVNALVFLKYDSLNGYAHTARLRMIDVETSSLLINASFSSSAGKGSVGGGGSIVRLVDEIDKTASRKGVVDVARLLGKEIMEQIK